MQYINAAIFGIVQGITEFLPISSSGHLAILHKIIDLPYRKNELGFDVALHLASLLAVILFFRKDILLLVKSLFNICKGKFDQYAKLAFFIILTTIPAAFAGYFLEDLIDARFRSINTIIAMLIIGGILLLAVERFAVKHHDINKLNWNKSLLIGFAQAISLIPGTSRSGITITAGLFCGLKREVAVHFSFLLSIPIILGASLVKIPELARSELLTQEFYILSVGFVFSFLFAFLTIKYFMKFIKKHSFVPFVFYRFALSLILIIFK